ncbi:Holliday junction branch migration protein RuvA [Alphaproteobacteria bacterium LSUCC0719]
MMIAQLRGAIVQIDDRLVIIDVGGVGYAVTVSGKTQALLSLDGGVVTLLTEMVVREDSMTLFGFGDAAEREAFRLLVTVQGVGAKAAMAILSVLTPDDLAGAIMAGDKAMVARADGVGPKLALRVVNELAAKIGALPVSGGGVAMAGAGTAVAGVAGSIGADAMSALVNLGYGRAEAHAALQRARMAGAAEDDLSALIAAALQEMGQ